MWLSKMSARALSVHESAAEIGSVTIGGSSPGVKTDSEKREVLVCMPGGYRWTPKVGGQVLLIKTDEGERAILGTLDGSEPEELHIAAGGAEIELKAGKVTVTGDLVLDGDLTVSGNAAIGGGLFIAGLPVLPTVQ